MRRIKDRYSSAVYSKTPDKTGLGRMQMYQIRLFRDMSPCRFHRIRQSHAAARFARLSNGMKYQKHDKNAQKQQNCSPKTVRLTLDNLHGT